MPTRQKPIKITLSIITLLIILCIAVYFILTGSFFLKNYAIPYLADKAGYNIKLKSIELSPFGSYLKINDLEVKSKNGIEFSTSKFDASVSFFELLGGTLRINKLDLDKTYLTIKTQSSDIQANSQKSNSSTSSNPKEKTAKTVVKNSKKSSNSRFKLDINNININNFNVQYIKGKSIASLSRFNLTLNHLSPGSEGILKFMGNLKLSSDGHKTISGNITSTTRINLSGKNILNEIKSYTKLTLGKTVTPIIINLQTSKNDNSKKFELTLNAKNIMLNRIIKTFIEGKYHNTSLKVKSIRLNIKGDYAENLLSSLKTNIKLVDADINSEGNFSLKTDSLNSSINLSNIDEGMIAINKLIIDNTSVKLINGPSSFALNNANVIIKNLGNDKNGSIRLNGDIDLNSKGRNIKGFISGKTNLFLNKNYFPEKIDSSTRLKIGSTITPITVKMTSNNKIARKGPFSLNINISNLKLQPLVGTFYAGPYSTAIGGIKQISISTKGNNLNAFENFLHSKNSNIQGSSVTTDIELKDVNISDKNKLLLTSKNLTTSFNLTDLICGNITLSKLHMANSVIKFTQIKKDTLKNNKQIKNIRSKNAHAVEIKTAAKSKPDKLINLKHISVKNLDLDYTLINSNDTEKSLYFGIRNGNINIPALKTNTQCSIKIKGRILSAVENKDNIMAGSLDSNSNFFLNSKNQPINIKSNSSFLEQDSKYPIKITLNSQGTGINSPFKISATAKELLLTPIFKALAPGVYKKTTGTLTSLDFNATGNDINKFDINKIKSQIAVSLANTSIPVQINKNETIEAIFIPIEIISNLGDNTLLKFLPPNVTQAFKQADWILNKRKMLDVSEGVIEVNMDNGIIDINKFQIKGTQNNGLNSMTLKGTINNINKKLNLENRTDFAGIIFPVEINGIISKPKTNTQQLVTGLLQNNTANAIKTGGDIFNSISSTIKNIKDKNLNEILAPQNSNDANNTEAQSTNNKNQSKPVHQILNTLDSFLNN